MLTALSDHWVHEAAFVEESTVDTLASHEVNEVFEGALETPVEVLPQIGENVFSLILRKYYHEFFENLLNTFYIKELVGHILELLEHDGFEGSVLLFQFLLDLLIQVIQLLPQLQLAGRQMS